MHITMRSVSHCTLPLRLQKTEIAHMSQACWLIHTFLLMCHYCDQFIDSKKQQLLCVNCWKALAHTQPTQWKSAQVSASLIKRCQFSKMRASLDLIGNQEFIFPTELRFAHHLIIMAEIAFSNTDLYLTFKMMKMF